MEVLETSSKTSICSKSLPDKENDNYLLVTYRIVEGDVKNFELKLRTIEGKKGEL